jgi:hypothetical protein
MNWDFPEQCCIRMYPNCSLLEITWKKTYSPVSFCPKVISHVSKGVSFGRILLMFDTVPWTISGQTSISWISKPWKIKIASNHFMGSGHSRIWYIQLTLKLLVVVRWMEDIEFSLRINGFVKIVLVLYGVGQKMCRCRCLLRRTSWNSFNCITIIIMKCLNIPPCSKYDTSPSLKLIEASQSPYKLLRINVSNATIPPTSESLMTFLSENSTLDIVDASQDRQGQIVNVLRKRR